MKRLIGDDYGGCIDLKPNDLYEGIGLEEKTPVHRLNVETINTNVMVSDEEIGFSPIFSSLSKTENAAHSPVGRHDSIQTTIEQTVHSRATFAN